MKDNIYEPGIEISTCLIKANKEPEFETLKGKSTENLILYALQHYSIMTARNISHYVAFKQKNRKINKLDSILKKLNNDGFVEKILIRNKDNNEIIRFYKLSEKSEEYLYCQNKRHKKVKRNFDDINDVLRLSMISQWQLLTDIVWDKKKSSIDNKNEIHGKGICIPSYSLIEKEEIRINVAAYPILPNQDTIKSIMENVKEIEELSQRFTSPKEKYINLFLVPNEVDLDKLLFMLKSNDKNIFVAIMREVIEMENAPVVYGLDAEGKKISYELTM